MIREATEVPDPKVDQRSVLRIELEPNLGESPEDFIARIKAVDLGFKQIEFKILGPTQARLLIGLNPQWEVAEEHAEDVANVSDDELLREFERTAAARVKNA